MKYVNISMIKKKVDGPKKGLWDRGEGKLQQENKLIKQQQEIKEKSLLGVGDFCTETTLYLLPICEMNFEIVIFLELTYLIKNFNLTLSI